MQSEPCTTIAVHSPLGLTGCAASPSTTTLPRPMHAGILRAARVNTGPSRITSASVVSIMSRQAVGKSANSCSSKDLASRTPCSGCMLLLSAASYVNMVGFAGLIFTCLTPVLLLPPTGPLVALVPARGVPRALAVSVVERGVVGADAAAWARAAAAASVTTGLAAAAVACSSPAGASAGAATRLPCLPLLLLPSLPLLPLPAAKPSKESSSAAGAAAAAAPAAAAGIALSSAP